MFQFVIVAVLVAGPLAGCASGGPVTAGNDIRVCAANFTEKGTFVAGRTFTSFAERAGANKSAVYERVVRILTTKGYQITNSNKDLGVVSASNPIIMGKGSRATMNVAVSDSQDRVRVDMTFLIPGLTHTSMSAVREEFCVILDGALSPAS